MVFILIYYLEKEDRERMDLVQHYADRGSKYRWNVASSSISGMYGNNAQLSSRGVGGRLL
jgi:hypothetical protein